MSPKADTGLCLGLNISDTVTKYIPIKFFVISNSPWCVKNPSTQLISRSTLHAFWLSIINAIQSSLWAGPGSCWWRSKALRALLNAPLFPRTRLLLDPSAWPYEVPNEASSIWQYFCLLFLEISVLQISPYFNVPELVGCFKRDREVIFIECLLNLGRFAFSFALSFLKKTRQLFCK